MKNALIRFPIALLLSSLINCQRASYDDTGYGVEGVDPDSKFVASGKADTYSTYSASSAVSYATSNYAKSYCSTPGCTTSGYNPWADYGSSSSGGNCTNFVSQAIIGGMIGSSSMTTTYGMREDFDIDYGSTSSFGQWYWVSTSKWGSAFKGANELYKYAKANKSTYKGLHFTQITYDTSTTCMDTSKVKTGDIIFADWTADGTIDHSMIVTKVSTSVSGYESIMVTYQSVAQLNIKLSTIRALTGYSKVLFYVFRPTDYSPSGL